MKKLKRMILISLMLFLTANLSAQNGIRSGNVTLKALKRANENLRHRLDVIQKQNNDILWFQKVGDVAYVDKLYITGPPRAHEPNPTGIGYGNPVKFWTYVFIPKWINPNKKYPLLVFPHGGVHSNFTVYYTHIIRELMAQGYIVVAPEYRGSTGYGKSFYQDIDYGGLEVEDVLAARNHMVNNYDIVDKNRVGIIGYSHGGLITLMSIFRHPKAYKIAFAGEPVSDLILRMGYHHQSYRDLYEAPYHIGKSAADNLEEYRRRSPAWNTAKMPDIPLLIHTNTIDADVNVLEVKHLIQALKADNKKFQYKIYKAIPGGHSFERLDTQKANEIRVKVYEFLANTLHPERPITTVRALRKAAYRF